MTKCLVKSVYCWAIHACFTVNYLIVIPVPTMNNIKVLLFALICTCISFNSYAEELSREQIKGLDEQVQEIKKDVLAISSELSLLEEKLLYPSNTQVSLFISVEKQSKYSPDAVQIKLDDKDVAHHIYSFKEVGALQRGGVQRIYTGNLKTGEHKLDVSVVGKASAAGVETNKASFTINKGIGAKLVEISLGSTSALINIKEQ